MREEIYNILKKLVKRLKQTYGNNLTYVLNSNQKIVLSAIPVTQMQYQEGKTPFLLNVKKEEKIIE